MPSSIVMELMREVATLKAQVKDILTLLKWQMGLLTAVFAALITFLAGK